MNQLARIAADSVMADQCINIEICLDGMYNKSYLFTIDDGRQVSGKMPNPNPGFPHFTTAKVATMDYVNAVVPRHSSLPGVLTLAQVRNNLGTPAPQVLAWSSRAENSVGVEYIIMEKMPVIQLSQVWDRLKFKDKLQVVTQLFRFQKIWFLVRFANIGSLYYLGDFWTGTAKGPVSAYSIR